MMARPLRPPPTLRDRQPRPQGPPGALTARRSARDRHCQCRRCERGRQPLRGPRMTAAGPLTPAAPASCCPAAHTTTTQKPPAHRTHPLEVKRLAPVRDSEEHAHVYNETRRLNISLCTDFLNTRRGHAAVLALDTATQRYRHGSLVLPKKTVRASVCAQASAARVEAVLCEAYRRQESMRHLA